MQISYFPTAYSLMNLTQVQNEESSWGLACAKFIDTNVQEELILGVSGVKDDVILWLKDTHIPNQHPPQTASRYHPDPRQNPSSINSE